MTRIIMCGCNGAMGRMITGIVNEDAEAEIVAGGYERTLLSCFSEISRL